MPKIDYKKELKEFYRPSAKKIVEVNIPKMNFLMVDGNGAPEMTEYKEAIEALYSVSYTIKFMIKKGDIGIDYGVLPLEGLWWADDMSDFINENKSKWIWTMMIMQPELVTKDLVHAAISQVKDKKNLPVLIRLNLNLFRRVSVPKLCTLAHFHKKGLQ